MNPTILTWLKGLAAAAISAAATTGGAILATYASGTGINWHQLEGGVAVSTLIAVCYYLKSSPLPGGTVTTLTSLPPGTSSTTTIINPPNPPPES